VNTALFAVLFAAYPADGHRTTRLSSVTRGGAQSLSVNHPHFANPVRHLLATSACQPRPGKDAGEPHWGAHNSLALQPDTAWDSLGLPV